MDNRELMDTRIWDYIDGQGTPAERAAVEQLIAEHAEWKAAFTELTEVHQLIQVADAEHPSMRFTRNVMEEIAKLHIAPAAREYINKKIIWGIAAFFITVIASFLIYGFSQMEWTSGNSNNYLQVDVPKLDFSVMFNNTYINIFMMANVILGLMLLDRYLGNRNKQLAKQASD